MADLFSREQVIRNLESSLENYTRFKEMIKISSNPHSKQTRHDLAYCEGIMAGLLMALNCLKYQDPIRK